MKNTFNPDYSMSVQDYIGDIMTVRYMEYLFNDREIPKGRYSE